MVDKTQYGWGAERRRMFTFFQSYGVAVCGWVCGWAVYVYIVCIHIALPRLKFASQPAIRVFIQTN